MKSLSSFFLKIVFLVAFIAATITEIQAQRGFATVGTAFANSPANGCSTSSCFEITSGGVGAVWDTSRIDLTKSFDIDLCVYVGDNDAGADGVCFILQPTSTTMIGFDGGYLGYFYFPFNSVGVEFDTHDNDPSLGDIPEDHVTLVYGSDMFSPVLPAVPAVSSGANMEDGAFHQFRIVWNAHCQLLQVYVDGELRISHNDDIVVNALGNNSNVFWGITGSTGSFFNKHQFCLNSITFPPDTYDTLACQTAAVTFDATTTAATAYLWSNGNTSATNTVTGFGTYWVDISVPNCTYRQTYNVDTLSGSIAPSIASVAGGVCPNTNTVLTASGGQVGAGATIKWYDAPNGGGNFLGTGSNITVSPMVSTTYYARYEGLCNNSADAAGLVDVKIFIYAANNTSTNNFCTDNAGWHHFFVGNEIILSLQGDVSSMGTISSTIMDNGTYYLNGGNANLCPTAISPSDQQFEMQRNWNIAYTGSLNGNYNVRFYYRPAERAAVETAAANWISTYPTCNYTYKYNPTANGWFWFKNTLGNYIAPQYDGLHLMSSANSTIGGINYSVLANITSFSGGTGGVILTPNVFLPIELINFDGLYQAPNNLLYWATASETNNAYFELERSSNSQQDFVKIGQVLGQGTTSETHFYQFEDSQPLRGTNYYRLRQVDFDGSATYSQIIALTSPNTLDKAILYPNPTTGIATYQTYIEQPDELQIEVLNLLGQVLHRQQHQLSLGLQSLDIDLSTYPSGTYILKLKWQNNQAVSLQKLMKID